MRPGPSPTRACLPGDRRPADHRFRAVATLAVWLGLLAPGLAPAATDGTDLDSVARLLDRGQVAAAQRALETLPPPGDAATTARLLWLRGEVQRFYGHSFPLHRKHARRLFLDALRAAKEHPRVECRVLLSLASLERESALDTDDRETRRELLESAVEQARAARKKIGALEDPDLAGEGRAVWAEVALARGWRTEAQETAATLTAGTDPDRSARGAWVLGQCAELTRRAEEARKHYRHAVEMVEKRRASLADELGDSGYVSPRLVAYQDAVRTHLQAGEAAEALWTAERARARFGDTPETLEAIETLPTRLDDETSILILFEVESGVAAWTVSSAGIRGHLLRIDSDELAAGLTELTQPRGHARATSTRLHRKLVAPVASELRPRVILAPYGHLRRLPFAALFDGQRYFFERHRLSRVARAVDLPASAQASTPGRVLVLLDPNTDYDRDGKSDFPPLSHAGDGLQAWFHAGFSPIVHRGSAATEEALKKSLKGSRFLHLACHGEFEYRQPWESSLRLASGPTGPGGGPGGDGRLTASEFRKLPLTGVDLVCLSGCETGLTGLGPYARSRRARLAGADDLAGFPRAILQAGAGGLLGSLWRVEDRRAARFMGRFYKHLSSGLVPSAALGLARQESLSSGHDASPEHWAAWVLLENRTRTRPPGSERGQNEGSEDTESGNGTKARPGGSTEKKGSQG